MSSMWFQPPFPFHGIYPPLSPLMIPPLNQNIYPSTNDILPQLKQLMNKSNTLPTASTSSFPHAIKENIKNDLKEDVNDKNVLNKWQMFLVESLLTASASSARSVDFERSLSTESCNPKSPATISPFSVCSFFVHFLTIFNRFCHFRQQL